MASRSSCNSSPLDTCATKASGSTSADACAGGTNGGEGSASTSRAKKTTFAVVEAVASCTGCGIEGNRSANTRGSLSEVAGKTNTTVVIGKRAVSSNSGKTDTCSSKSS